MFDDKTTMIRRYKIDKLCKELADILEFDSCDGAVDVSKVIDAIAPSDRINNLISDCGTIERSKFQIGFYKHKTIENLYLFAAIGNFVMTDIELRSQFIQSSHLKPLWVTAANNFVGSFYLMTTDKQVELPPTIDSPKLSIFVISRLYIWMRKSLEKMYRPGTTVVNNLEINFNYLNDIKCT